MAWKMGVDGVSTLDSRGGYLGRRFWRAGRMDAWMLAGVFMCGLRGRGA